MALWGFGYPYHTFGYPMVQPFGLHHPMGMNRTIPQFLTMSDQLFDALDTMFEIPSAWLESRPDQDGQHNQSIDQTNGQSIGQSKGQSIDESKGQLIDQSNGQSIDQSLQSTDQPRHTTQMINTDDKFQINLHVDQFKPDQLSVKCVKDRFLVVSGKREVEKDTDGAKSYVIQEFTRSFVVPKGVDVAQLKSSMSKDGVLAIEAPKKPLEIKNDERMIAIEQSNE